MSWQVSIVGKKALKLKDAVLLEGLPGIGNVGKVTVDFIVDELKATKYAEFFSYSMPNSVFVNEKNLVELPKIELYYKKNGKNNLLLLAGDIQPIDEISSYEFCEAVLNVVEKLGCKEIITMGGIGLPNVPKKPIVYCTGNSEGIVKKYTAGTKLNRELFGVVGPIVGVSGLLLGLAKNRNIEAVALLAETFGHPMYLGVKGAREILNILNKKLNLKLNIKRLDKDIKEVESEIKRKSKDSFLPDKMKELKGIGKEANYIG